MKRTYQMRSTAMSILILCTLVIGISACSEDIDINEEKRHSFATRTTTSLPEYVYPTVDDILSDPFINQRMDEAWQSCKARISDSCRAEYGFNIYFKINGTYSTSSIIHGPVVVGIDTTSCSFVTPPCDNAERQERCAIFHTHTSLAFFPPNMFRRVGPSRSDTLYERKHKIPLLTRDYAGEKIRGGESPDKEYRDYPCELLSRPLN